MTDLEALRLALYLFHVPAGVRAARTLPLPKGIIHLLEIAAGDDEVADNAALKLERTADVIREAAGFFIEQILLAPDGDSYRVLGGGRDASDVELRRNMALLLRWLHPDLDRAGARTIYAGRVTRAWETLKTPDRRTAYDVANPPRVAKPKTPRRSSRQPPRYQRFSSGGAGLDAVRDTAHDGFIQRTLRFMFGRTDKRR